MVVGEVPEAADFVVVGAGPGGYAAALYAARNGRRVMLVERDGAAGVGGVCLREGCIPSKALIEMAQFVSRLGDAAAMGVRAESVGVDLARFQGWKDELVGNLTGAVRRALDAARVEIVAGSLALVDDTTAVISTRDGQARFVEFRDLLLATGSRALELDDLAFDGRRVLDSTGALALCAVPDSMAVVGAGYIGIELGIAFAKLGTRVAIVEARERILPTLPAELGAPVDRRMRELGVDLLLDARVQGWDGDELCVMQEQATRAIDAEIVLVAIGRRPNHDALGLPAAGIHPAADGTLDVAPDRRLKPHIAAIGDLTPGPALAHKATAEARVAVDALCGTDAAFEPASVPVVIFSDPEIATAGLSRAAASARAEAVQVARLPLAASGRAATLGRRDGFAEIVADPHDGTVLGVHIAGPHASELIAEGVLAIEMGASLEDLALTIHPHPTLSEQIAEAARSGFDRASSD